MSSNSVSYSDLEETTPEVDACVKYIASAMQNESTVVIDD